MSEVQHFEVISEDIEKPYTMVKIRHVSNGVTYEARGWACWDGQGDYREWEGVNIALTRARRKIARRLEWEAGLEDELLRLRDAATAKKGEVLAIQATLVGVHLIHRDGGTVQL